MKTAVEWLEIEFKKIPFSNPVDSIKKAKEIEKEQIILSYIHKRYVLAGGHPIRRDEAEEYYNQTYNQNAK
jgi:hypothetical protein